MHKKKIVVCDAIHAKGLAILQAQPDIEMIEASSLPKEELLGLLGDCDVAITRSSTDVDARFLDAAPKVQAIVRAGVGVDNVAISDCSKRGIIVMNVPTANTIAAVELTMAHLLASARSFPYAHNHLKQLRVWKREDWYGVELMGKKLGVIGFGNIGSRVGVRAKAFGMDVLAYDPYIPSTKATELGIRYTKNFDDILACDFITIHTPKNKETTNMIDTAEIAKMHDGVRLINVARGGLYNENALYDGLKSGKIAFAGIDVFTKEPATDNKLLDLDNVSVTPHLGANTYESQEKIAIHAAEQAISAARGTSYPNALNLPIKTDEIPPFLAPYLELAQKMGFMAAQITKSPITSIKIEAEGEIAEYLKSLLTFTLVGSLRESLGENINYVNAEYVANEHRIKASSEKITKSSGYKNKLTVKLTTEGEAIALGGSVFDDELQRVVSINSFALDIDPKGKMIIFQNKDVPGVIADISTLLKEQRINIADFRLGRDNSGLAMAVIIVDQDISKEALKALGQIPNCIWVSYVVI